MNPMVRLFVAAGCFAAWLALLVFGFAAGGVVHALAVAAIVLVPWRAGAAPPASKES